MYTLCFIYRNWQCSNVFADVKVVCEKDSVRITWRISAELVPNASRLFLGSCMPSQLKVLPTGEGDAHFNYQLGDCKFKKQVKVKRIFNKSFKPLRLSFFQRPVFLLCRWKENTSAIKINWPTGRMPGTNLQPLCFPSSAFIKGIYFWMSSCRIQSLKAEMCEEELLRFRPESWIPAFLNPGSGVSEGRGGLVVHMALLNGEFPRTAEYNMGTFKDSVLSIFLLRHPTEQLTGVAKTNVVPLGSFMPIWAAVEQKSHQPLLLLMEECVAATTPELHPGSQVHPIITNKG